MQRYILLLYIHFILFILFIRIIDFCTFCHLKKDESSKITPKNYHSEMTAITHFSLIFFFVFFEFKWNNIWITCHSSYFSRRPSYFFAVNIWPFDNGYYSTYKFWEHNRWATAFQLKLSVFGYSCQVHKRGKWEEVDNQDKREEERNGKLIQSTIDDRCHYVTVQYQSSSNTEHCCSTWRMETEVVGREIK